ncbi:Fis family nitrogen metabolism transcriptional regulator NtrC [Thiogranum longum]|uniref:DNA-binding transcriptional regulator NtrC n=1 Tax=Thiogranum longum TaxID=1537524 RepID=A0A4R1H9T1_9GAMM|nr:nitrogen regulation protein NR(I) [Thiogranum longum]TCK16880.1 Fis family nitrogen metabolism transcriptional regulator NtrC [Thiogranum longum]
MKEKASVWVIDDDQSIRWVLEKALEKAGMKVNVFTSANGILEALQRSQPDAMITDVRMPGMDGFELLNAIQEDCPDLPVIIITAHSDLDSAVTAYQGGAFEYLPKPFDIEDAVELTQRAIEQSRSHAKGADAVKGRLDTEIIGEAPAMQEVFRAIGRLSRSNITVLINGESGTGKELVALALHRHSPRADNPFIALNMAAIPRDLLESELFGHERGAFTGAQSQRVGRFEQADGGTLFLDEIGDMPAEMQTRLLRVLSDGEFYRVGGHTPVNADVRIIAATHQDLEKRVLEGSFREDLFHRLNVIRIHLPAVRERREDIPLLMRHFLQAAARELSVDVKQLLPETESYLGQLEWPGNVRQIENLCRWLMVMAPGQEIRIDDLPVELRQSSGSESTVAQGWESALRAWASRKLAEGEEALLEEALPAFERVMIETALAQTGGRRQDAARLLGWGRNTLTRKIRELELDTTQ